MKYFFTFAFTLLVASVSYAQRQNIYFLKNDGRYVDTKDSADYMRIVREPDSASILYNVFEFYINGNKKLIGKSITINPPVFDGQCMTFYPNGSKELLTNYKNGSKIGDEIAFFPNGKLYLVKTYSDAEHINSGFSEDYIIKSSQDSTGKQFVIDGNGYFIGYNDKFTIVKEEGHIKNGKKDGLWKGEDDEFGVKSFTETYDNGNMLTGNAVAKDGKTTSYTKSREINPQFYGGNNGFSLYLINHIIYPVYAREHNIEGRVIIDFVVEKNGKLSDIKVKRFVQQELDDEAVRVLKISPKWVPGTIYGLPVRVRFSVPINFSLTGN